MDWFNSRYSDADLADILSDYSKSVTGYRDRQHGTGRCAIVSRLEDLDAFTASPLTVALPPVTAFAAAKAALA